MYVVRYKIRIKEGATIPYGGKDQPVIYFIGEGSKGRESFNILTKCRRSLEKGGECSERREYDSLSEARSFMWFMANIKEQSPKHWLASDGVTIDEMKLLKEVEV